MLAKWPGCKTNILWVEKPAERYGEPTQGKTNKKHVMNDSLFVSFSIENVRVANGKTKDTQPKKAEPFIPSVHNLLG